MARCDRQRARTERNVCMESSQPRQHYPPFPCDRFIYLAQVSVSTVEVTRSGGEKKEPRILSQAEARHCKKHRAGGYPARWKGVTRSSVGYRVCHWRLPRCVMVTGLPAIVSVVVRANVEGLAAIKNVTVAVPLLGEPE